MPDEHFTAAGSLERGPLALAHGVTTEWNAVRRPFRYAILLGMTIERTRSRPRPGFEALLLCLALCGCRDAGVGNGAAGQTYFVDSAAGSDANDGLSASAAWKTLARTSKGTLAAGSSVLLKRGGWWREQLVPASGAQGAPVTYGAYGSGPKPRISAAVSRPLATDWSSDGSGDWTCSPGCGLDVGNVLFVQGSSIACGVKRWSMSALAGEKDFYYDEGSDTIYLRSASDPGSQGYDDIELAIDAPIVDETGKSWITYSGLDLRYGGAHGIGGGETRGIAVEDCEISWVGGGKLRDQIRFGNGVEFWDDASDELVERCYVHDVYDSGLTNQAYDAPSVQERIAYRDNIVVDCGMGSFEYWNLGSRTSDIVFEGNTCVGAGSGWGSTQDRPDADTAGYQVRLAQTPSDTGAFAIRDDVFLGSSKGLLQVFAAGGQVAERPGWAATEIDYDIWYEAEGLPAFVIYDSDASAFFYVEYPLSGFDTFRSLAGKGARSFATDPLLVDEGATSPEACRPSPASPALGSGEPGPTVDFGGNPRSATAPSIGAWER
jgi:hypothetical protein